MTAVEISDDIQKQLFGILSGILHLGNVDFEMSKNVEKEDITIVTAATDGYLATAADLLGFDKETLSERLCYRTLMVGKGNFDEEVRKRRASVKNPNSNVYRIPLTPQEASYARDALSKCIFSYV
jgi:myosin heavy subunit